jgi:hypothetical protein
MPFAHGKNAKLYVNGYDISAWLTKAGTAEKADVAEASVLGTTDKQYLNGMAEGSITGDGFWDDTSAGPAGGGVMGSAFLIDPGIFTFMPQGDGFGKPATGMLAPNTDFAVDTDTGNVGTFTFAATSRIGFDSGDVLHQLQSESAGGNGVALDGLAPTSFGLDSYLQVTAKVGAGALQVKTQHSPDNTTWTDLCVHTVVTTVTHQAEWISSFIALPSGSVFRYTRALWTLASGSAVFSLVGTRLYRPH